jgi:hypothetical protein
MTGTMIYPELLLETGFYSNFKSCEMNQAECFHEDRVIEEVYQEKFERRSHR